MPGEQRFSQKRNLVGDTADTLRERIFAAKPGALIGSLQDLARSLGVGIVTLQQAARVLEHEGLLEAKRGPGGGYYGTRPDAAAMERSLAVYMRMNPTSYEEALDMTSLLFNELVTAAAGCTDERLRADLSQLAKRVEATETMEDFGVLEIELQELLFRMVKRPLFELLTRVTLRYSSAARDGVVSSLDLEAGRWKSGRRRIIAAILAKDPDLARFEAQRSNRDVIQGYLLGQVSEPAF